MPSHFQAISEYKRTFKPHESFLSRSYKGSPEQLRQGAGKPSTLVFPLHNREPPLQRKRRVHSPLNQTVHSRDPLPQYPDSERGERIPKVSQSQDAYALLGPQDKFSSNVAYRIRRSESSEKVAQPQADDYARQERGRTWKRNEERRNEAVTKQATKRVKVLRENADDAASVDNGNAAYVEQEPPNAPRGRVQTPLLDELEFDPRSRAKPPSNGGNENAPPARQQPDSYYSKRYEIGLEARPQRSGTAKLKESEYQRAFEGHAPRPSAPVLSAYDIFHRSRSLPIHTRLRRRNSDEQINVGSHAERAPRYEPPNYKAKAPAYEPVKNDRVERPESRNESVQVSSNDGQLPPKPASAREARRGDVASNLYRTEYNRNYLDWQPTIAKLDENAKRALTRSRSLDSLRSPAAKPELRSRYVPRTVEVGGKTYKLADLFGGVTRGRRWPTEYAARFRNHFEAAAQKAQADVITEATNEAGTLTASRNEELLQELRELRDRAGENRQRARGSHFSSEHATQLLSNRARLWDVTPRSSEDRSDRAQAEDDTNRGDEQADVRAPVEAEEPDDYAVEYDPRRDASSSVRADKFSESERNEDDLAITVPVNRPLRIPAEVDGRVPTPRLVRVDADTGRPVQRHHLDRTTPFYGSLFAQSPNVADSSVSPRSTVSSSRSTTPRIPYDAAKYTDRVAIAAERAKKLAEMRPAGLPTTWEERPRVLVTREDDDAPAPVAARLLRTAPPADSYEKQPESSNVSRRPAGKSTFDAHPLADPAVRYDKPLVQKHKPTRSLPVSAEHDRERANRRVQTEFERNEAAQTDELAYKNERVQADLSARSSTSSLSLAQKTLEKARNRQDFWRP